MSGWTKQFPTKLTKGNPTRRSAAEIIAGHHQMGVEDFKGMVDIDERVYGNLNVMLKYRMVLLQES